MLKVVFTPLAWIFSLGVWLRNWGYDHGLFCVRALNRPVISVGNLSMGGAGKTPLCDALIKGLRDRGCRVGVLSRGYGRRDPKRVLRVDPQGDWLDYGDEPMMLARRNPEACVCVGADRYAAARQADVFDPHTFILDDGFQHRAIKRDLDIVLIDVTQPMPRLFPAGLFRESWSALRRADLAVLSRCESDRPPRRFLDPIRRICPTLPVLTCRMVARHIVLASGETIPVGALAGKKVGAFAGIAQPHKFFDLLRRLGAELTATRSLADHQTLDAKGLSRFRDACRSTGANWSLTTEKDWIKLEESQKSDILLGFLPLDVVWGDEAEWNKILDDFVRDRKPDDQKTTGPA